MYISKKIAILGTIFVAMLFIFSVAYSQRSLTEGQQPYSLNRLEWLEVVLTQRHPALYYVDYVDGEAYNIKYVAKSKENTIRIEIYYDKDIEAEQLLRIIDIHKAGVLEELDQKGWKNWCKIEVHTESVNIKKLKNATRKNTEGSTRSGLRFEPVEKPY